MTETSKPEILLVEDSRELAVVYEAYLNKQSYGLTIAENGKDALKNITESLPQVILLDLQLPDMSGMEILEYINHHHLPVLVIVITAHGTVDTAVDAMRCGAFDFITKPIDAERLIVTVRNAIEHQRLNNVIDTYKETFQRDHYHGFIGGSLSMQATYRIIDSAAPSAATLFITGESGTGKELAAEAIHKQSPRNEKPFIAINCAAIPKDLIESELFGHVKGAFTGAVSNRHGAVMSANGGTLFLDEVCEMEFAMQSKLLRFLQTKSFQKIGSDRLEKVDVRIICATNRNPLDEVKEGRFREDLYYRLHVVPLHLPPLRDREADVILIANKLLEQYSQEEGKQFTHFAPETEVILQNFDWPGNVRELQNVIRNIVVLNVGGVVQPDMLPFDNENLNKKIYARSERGSCNHVNKDHLNDKGETIALAEGSDQPDSIKPLSIVEKDYIERAIVLCGNNIPKAAAMLDVSASTLYRKRQAWEEVDGIRAAHLSRSELNSE